MRSRGYIAASCISLLSLILSLVATNGTSYIVTATPRDEPLFESRYGLFRRCDRSAVDREWRCRRYPKRTLDCPPRAPFLPLATPGQSSSPLSDLARLRFSNLMGLRHSNDEPFRVETMPRSETVYDAAAVQPPMDGDRSRFGFCHQYITAGYAAQLSVMMAACASLAFILVMLPPITSRERKVHGWKVAAGLMGVQVLLQLISTALIAHLLATSGRFPESSGLGPAFALATASWSVGVILIGGLLYAEVKGIARLPDHGYTAIPDGE